MPHVRGALPSLNHCLVPSHGSRPHGPSRRGPVALCRGMPAVRRFVGSSGRERARISSNSIPANEGLPWGPGCSDGQVETDRRGSRVVPSVIKSPVRGSWLHPSSISPGMGSAGSSRAPRLTAPRRSTGIDPDPLAVGATPAPDSGVRTTDRRRIGDQRVVGSLGAGRTHRAIDGGRGGSLGNSAPGRSGRTDQPAGRRLRGPIGPAGGGDRPIRPRAGRGDDRDEHVRAHGTGRRADGQGGRAGHARRASPCACTHLNINI
jgi:hypothetical protein